MLKKLLILSAFWQPGVSVAADMGLDLKHFRVAGLSAFQSNGNLFTGNLIWNPSYIFNNDLSVNVKLGGYPVKHTDETISEVLEYAIQVSYHLSNFSLETDIGQQFWLANSLAMNTLSFGVAVPINPIWYINEVFSEYSLVLVPKTTTQEIKLGIGLF